MLNLPPRRTKYSRSQQSKDLGSIRNFLCLALVSSGCFSLTLPLLALPIPAPGTPINNTATGSFVDEADTTNTPITIISNTVSVTYAEVAGISVSSPIALEATTAQATASINGPGDYQGDSKISVGDLVYYDFVITNIGNDPTQFFIPGTATVTGGTVEGPLQILNYNCGCGGVSPTVTPPTTILVPVNGQRTGKDAVTSSSPNLLGDDGIFQPTGYVTVRVAVRIPTTATAGSPVTVKLGNTTPDANNSTENQPKSGAAADEIYTIDNNDILGITGDTTGSPANGEREASSLVTTTLAPPDARVISGRVFDDVNYGGGAGRDYNTANTNAQASGFTNNQIARAGATVELYKLNMLLASTTTDANGFYKFPRLQTNDTDNYTVRVVNSTVTSVRDTAGTSQAVAVQTFRTTNTGSIGTLDGVTDHVGGEDPASIDAPVNTTALMFSALDTATGQKVQSPALISLKTTGTDVTNVDFGYNFDTIVNTKDSGQGSLRQFITNSNALPNTKLAQVSQPAGKEVSIFMISDGGTHLGLASGLTNQLSPQGVAMIQQTTMLPKVTDTNTSIDGTTQTTNIGNTNNLALSYTGKVGTGADGIPGNTDDTLFNSIAAPEVEIIGTQTGTSALEIDGNSFLLRGVSVHGSGFQGTVNQINGCVRFNGTNDFTVEKSYVGISATSLSKPSSTQTCQSHGIGSTVGVTNMTLTNNLVAYNGVSGMIVNAPSPYVNLTIAGNESAFNGWNQIDQGDGLSLAAATGSITGNYLHDNQGYGIQDDMTNGQVIANNKISNNGLGGTETSGIMEWGTTDNTIEHNIISNNAGDGIAVARDPADAAQALSNKITISQNSTSGNAHLGINLAQPTTNPTVDYRTGGLPFITANDGTLGATFANNGMDYPVITANNVSADGKTLRVRGFVGIPGQTTSPFAGATLEVFKADKALTVIDDAGNVIVGDNLTKSHGEGKMYLGAAINGTSNVVKPDGTFDFIIDIDNKLVKGNGDAITLTATLGKNTSEFSSLSDPFKTPAKILVVKRITRVGTQDLTNTTDISGGSYDPDVPNTYDNHPNWPSGYIQGVRNLTLAKKIQPGAEIEYTLYFINVGEQDGQKVKICDFITPYQVYKPNTYNLAGNSDGGYGDMGLELGIGQSGISNTIKHLSGLKDPDRGEYFAPGVTTPARCQASGTITNTTGAIAVDVTNSSFPDIPGSTSTTTGVSTPVPNSYGYIRFKTRVD